MWFPPGHYDISGNDKTDQSAKLAYATAFVELFQFLASDLAEKSDQNDLPNLTK